MNQRILNRSGQLPDDGFYQIEALGEHVNHAARVVQVIDAQAVASIVNRFNAEAAAAGESFSGLRIDKDHLSQSMENPTEALGWSMQLRNRGGVPEARIDWTALGRPLVEAKEGQPPVYKFFSTEYEPAECEQIGTRTIKNRAYKLVRPLRLAGLSLTNDPNNKGQRPISNRNGTSAGADDENPPTTMKNMLKALGLDENASEDAGLAAIQKITNRASSAETDLAALKTEHKTLLDAQVEADLEKYKNRFKPDQREKFKKALIANRAGTIELLDAMAEPVTVQPRITNRGGATPPAREPGAAEGDDESKARRISNRANELRSAVPGRSWDSCWSQAVQEDADASTKK